MTQVAEPQAVRTRDAARLERVHHWIGGRPVAGASGRSGPVYNPATGELAREVDFASAEEVDAAVAAARPPSPRGAPPRCRSAPRSCSGSATSSTPTARRSLPT